MDVKCLRSCRCHISLILLTLALSNNCALLLPVNSNCLSHCLQLLLKAQKLQRSISRLTKEQSFFSLVLDRYLLISLRISQYTPDVLNLLHKYSLTSRRQGGGMTKPNPFLRTQDLNREIPLRYCCSTVGSLPTHCCPKSKKERGDLVQKTPPECRSQNLAISIPIWILEQELFFRNSD